MLEDMLWKPGNMIESSMDDIFLWANRVIFHGVCLVSIRVGAQVEKRRGHQLVCFALPCCALITNYFMRLVDYDILNKTKHHCCGAETAAGRQTNISVTFRHDHPIAAPLN